VTVPEVCGAGEGNGSAVTVGADHDSDGPVRAVTREGNHDFGVACAVADGERPVIDPATWRQRCTVAYLDEPPYFMPVDGADPTGCDIELAGLVLGALGVRRVEFVLTTFGELIDGVMSRRWHINAPMFITAERARRVRFSVPVWAATDGFIVRSNDVRDFTSYEAIAGDDSIRLAAVTGQVQVATALRAGVSADRIVQFADQSAAASAVLVGDADASVSTAPGNLAYMARLGDPRLVSVADSRTGERGGLPLGAFSFHTASRGLAHAFDGQLRRILGTGLHLEMMARYGFDEPALRPALLAAADR
jgi:polar amino acid transport system substrate-binding protein